MKRILMAVLILVLLSGCGGKETETLYGTVETGSTAQVYRNEIYYLDPVGCVYENTGVSSYSWETEEKKNVVSLVDEDVISFAVTENGIYAASSCALYHCSGDTNTELFRVENDWDITWMFEIDGTLYFCMSGYDETVFTKIMAMDPSNGETSLISQRQDAVFRQGNLVCCFEGKLYRYNLDGEIYVLNLQTGETEVVETEQSVEQIFATKKGIVVSYGPQEDSFLLLDGTIYGPSIAGTLYGSDGESLYFLEKQYLNGMITRLHGGETTVLVDGFSWDMVTEPGGFAAGAYVLFYTNDALTEKAIEADLYHNLYILNVGTGEIRCIGGYTQDYLFL